MGFRFRKSIKIAKGVSINLNKNSVGLSVGRKGARYTVNSKGRKTATVGVPGTGLYYTQSSGTGNNTKGEIRQQAIEKKPMKTGLVPMILTILFGWMGLHWFISGRAGMGFLYLFTMGLFGVGWIVDIVRQIIAFVKLLNRIKTEESN